MINEEYIDIEENLRTTGYEFEKAWKLSLLKQLKEIALHLSNVDYSLRRIQL